MLGRFSAAASHFFVGDGPSKWVAPLVFAGVTLASWALRSPERRLAEANPSIDRGAVTWLVPIGILVVMLILSFVALPKGTSSLMRDDARLTMRP